MRAVAVFAAFLWLGQVNQVQADQGQAGGFYNGNVLHEQCQPHSHWCQGYITGVADVMGNLGDAGFLGWRACLRGGMRSEQVVDVVKQWLQNHPERRDYKAVSLVAQALAEAFPCPK